MFYLQISFYASFQKAIQLKLSLACLESTEATKVGSKCRDPLCVSLGSH